MEGSPNLPTPGPQDLVKPVGLRALWRLRGHIHTPPRPQPSLSFCPHPGTMPPVRTGGDTVTQGSCPITITGEFVPTPDRGQVSVGPWRMLAGCALLGAFGPLDTNTAPRGHPEAPVQRRRLAQLTVSQTLAHPSSHSDHWTLVPQPPGGRQQKRSALVSMGQASTSGNCPLHPALKFPGWS